MTTTEPTVTHGDGADMRSGEGAAQARMRARVGDDSRSLVPFAFRISHITERDRLVSAARRLAATRPYTDRPASIAQVVAYTRAGGWVPGERSWQAELPGHLYGWLIAIPVTVALYGVAWILQRPVRVAVFAVIAGLLWLASSCS